MSKVAKRFSARSCEDKDLARDDDSKKHHRAQAAINGSLTITVH